MGTGAPQSQSFNFPCLGASPRLVRRSLNVGWTSDMSEYNTISPAPAEGAEMIRVGLYITPWRMRNRTRTLRAKLVSSNHITFSRPIEYIIVKKLLSFRRIHSMMCVSRDEGLDALMLIFCTSWFTSLRNLCFGLCPSDRC